MKSKSRSNGMTPEGQGASSQLLGNGLKESEFCEMSSSGSGRWGRLGRGLLVAVLGLILLGFCSWTIILYSVKLLRLQERVEYLENKIQEQDKMIPEQIQRYLDTHLDSMVQKVRNCEESEF